MIVEYDRSFEKSLGKIKNKAFLSKVEQIISSFENARSLHALKNISKLTGFKAYFRVKIGDYRLGFEKINENTIRLIIIVHRKDIYKLFP
ncbi:MAG: type II toxin-antitoxin system RelE/ParE family toxin [Saprospiraceae bacterium]|nr:type II toxin-antitoxin system RelE/ParE family toxin [Saprospiraceae bacterium]